MPQFQIVPLGTSEESAWKMLADGQEIRPRILEITHEEWGRIAFGKRPEGFHGWAYWPAKNGTVTIPYSWTPDKRLLIGLILESRAVMGPKKILGPLGGAVELGETAAETARREDMEEGGIDSTGSFPLGGLPVNTDRTCFVQDPHEGRGLYFFGLEVPFSMLEPSDDGWQLKPGTIASKRECELRFLPWRAAIEESPDAVALAGIARLLSVIASI